MEDGCPPQGLTTATPLASNCPPPYPNESRSGHLRHQAPRAVRAVLTTPFVVDPFHIPPANMADVSPSQSRWIGRQPPAPCHSVSGTADTAGSGECAPYPGPNYEAPARLETGWEQSPKEKDTQLLFRECVWHTPDLAHATMNTAVFDVNARHCALLAASLLLFAMDAFPFDGRRNFLFLRRAVFRCGKSHLFRDHQTYQHIVSDLA